MAQSRSIVILGAGGHARVLAETCRAAGLELAGFVAALPQRGEPVEPADAGIVLGGDELLALPSFIDQHEFLVGIGSEALRAQLSHQLRGRGAALASVRHPSAVVADDVSIGAGSVVLAGAVVQTGSIIGESVIINTGATVDHDNRIADGAQIGPGANLAGDVEVGEEAFVGTGASVIPGRRIGARAVVGAGAVVVSNVPSGVTVVGVPARVVQRG